MRQDGIAILVENDNFVIVKKESFTTLVVQQHDKVGFLLLVVDDDVRAAFAESFNDFRGLRPRATAAAGSEAS